MEMERPNTVWARDHCGYSNWYDDTYCARLIGGVAVQNKPEFWCHLLATSFVVGFILGYAVAAYVAVTLSK